MGRSNVFPVAVPGSSGTITGAQSSASGDVTYHGYSLRETSGTDPAVVRIRGDASATGRILDTIHLAANESAQAAYLPQGIRAKVGLYFQIVSGAVEGTVRIG